MRCNRLYFLVVFVLLLSCRSSYEVVNKGIAGNNSAQLLARVDRDVIEKDPDLVIIMIGTNDMINSRKFLSFDEYFQNLSEIISKIRAADKTTAILLANVLPVDEDYLFSRHKKELFPIAPNVKLDSLNQALKTFALKHNFFFVDVNKEFRNPTMEFKKYDSLLINALNGEVNDGVHPTREGYHLIATKLYNTLKEAKLLKRKMKIICFGDSITYGAFMSGQGTVAGDTYPAQLLNLLSTRN